MYSNVVLSELCDTCAFCILLCLAQLVVEQEFQTGCLCIALPKQAHVIEQVLETG